jgi:Tfp pilus assembly ATPase PilU
VQTFDQALFHLCQAGEITIKDALLHADSENNLRIMLKLQNQSLGSSCQTALEKDWTLTNKKTSNSEGKNPQNPT